MTEFWAISEHPDLFDEFWSWFGRLPATTAAHWSFPAPD